MAATLAAGAPSHAIRPDGTATDGLEVPRGVRARGHGPVRPAPRTAWGAPPPARALAWSRFVAEAGTAWSASWDVDTRVPSRIMGGGVPAPGAVADAAAAAHHARAFLARHIDLLAPGADPADFVLVANRVRHGLRVVGFRQTHQGLTVQGGQVSFRYKNDRLFVIGSEALPDVAVTLPPFPASADAARSFAAAWVLSDRAREATPGAVGAPVILPLVGGGSIDYRVVRPVDVEARAPIGRYRVYTDATLGAVVAREQTLRFASGSVAYRAWVRSPQGEQDEFPARRAALTIDAATVESDDQGDVTWGGASSGALVVRARGALVSVANDAGEEAEQELTIPDGGTAVWDGSTDDLLDAQLNGFIHGRIVKEYARDHLAPDMEWLDEQLEVVVNIDQACNAFSDGNAINFFQANGQCENTGRLADVIYHEFGHSLHAHAMIEGVGAFDGAHSEGLSDYLAASVTGDPAMGRGFFFDDGPLRHIDPPDREAIWPRDVEEIHTTGVIFAGAMWDLRKLLIEQYGEEEGIAMANRLFYATLERATNIPATYAEVLAEDDDDGDLSNGTPNVCEIATAFGAHGLRELNAQVTPLAAEMPGEEGFPIELRMGGLYAQCPGDGIAGASLRWHLRGQDPDADGQEIELAAGEDGAWVGTIPSIEPEQVLRYGIHVEFLDGGVRELPDNPADRYYEFYVGEVTPLYCTDFETDPFEDGWTHGLSSGDAEEGADDWAWGPPTSPASSGDPGAAFSGDGVLGNDIGGENHDGLYQPDKVNYVQTPVIDVERYSDVHIQYWRWLTVEDAFFDQATIYADDQVAWQNLNSDEGDSSATQHLDGEWRFQSIPVSRLIPDGELQVKFEMASDGGLEFGGWTIDDFCVVANPASICGDGEVSGAEDCDDGDDNVDGEPDACRTNCRAPVCGDGVVDSGEACDDGNTRDGDECNAACDDGDENADCGCLVAPRRGGPDGRSFVLLVAAAGVLLLARRRRRTCRPG
ncbi:MAG TPA: DUF4215 domain-containing protein [Kofleriaceae bacterium]|nr:DUF4215 domain-containing protein [Kofleriaceae bacterium]